LRAAARSGSIRHRRLCELAWAACTVAFCLMTCASYRLRRGTNIASETTSPLRSPSGCPGFTRAIITHSPNV
jgi:hypothetical protein